MPEEFIDVGAVDAGQAVHVRAVVSTEDALDTHLAVGAAAAKAGVAERRGVALDGAGHLATGPVRLRSGDNVLDLRLTAIEAVDPLRAHFAFVADAEGYRRPEWLRAAGPSSKSAVVAFSTVVSLPADAESATVLLGANGPCRLVVDGVEAGRQGGFDPYEEGDFDRLQPYDLTASPRRGRPRASSSSCSTWAARVPRRSSHALVHTAHGTVAVRSDAQLARDPLMAGRSRSTSGSRRPTAIPRTRTPGAGRIRCRRAPGSSRAARPPTPARPSPSPPAGPARPSGCG